MEIGRHYKIVFFGYLHKTNGFGLPLVAIGMRAVFRIREIAVQIHPVGIVTFSTGNRIVAPVVGAVGIGQWVDPYFDVVDQTGNLRISTIVG